MKKSELFFTFILIPVDLIMVILAFISAYQLRLHFENVPITYVQPFMDYLKFVLPVLPAWPIILGLTGLYSLSERRSAVNEFGKIVVAGTASIALVIAWIFLSRTFFFSRLIIIFTWALAVITIALGRGLIRFIQTWLYRYNIGVHRVIVLAANGSSKMVIRTIKDDPRLGMKIVKIIDQDAISKLEKIVENSPCDEIILADSNLKEAQVARILDFCRIHQIALKMTPNLLLVRSSHIDIQQLAGIPILEFKRTPLDGWGRIIKRAVDIFGSIILIIILSPIMIIAALLVKLTSKGPILFRQERVGLDKNFTFLKFRSMKFEYCTGDSYGGKKAQEFRESLKKKKNEVDGPVFKIKNDPRITGAGKFLRKTSIDELPQLFNVLKGEMSLVGPRPPMPEEVAEYSDFQKRRLGVKPGITGLWQVSGRSELSFDEWVKLDAYYIEHWSLWLDFVILLRTVKAVVRRRGAY